MKQSQRIAAALAAGGLLAASAAQAVELVAVTTDNRLTSFDSASPSMLGPFVEITGITPGARIVGIDTRPGDNKVYGVGTDNMLYTLDITTGAATLHSTLSGASIDPMLSYGMDFNPVADAAAGSSLRLVSSDGSNFAINADTGVIGNTTSVIPTNFGGVAYTNSTNDPAPAATSLYYIDFTSDMLYLATSAFNTPTITAVGSLGLDTIGAFGFDILADGSAYATLTSGVTGLSGLYGIDLATGAATLLGEFGDATPLLAGMTAAPVPEAETYAMMLAGLGLVGWMARRRKPQA